MNFSVIGVIIWLNIKLTVATELVYSFFVGHFSAHPKQLGAATPKVLTDFCPKITESYLDTYKTIELVSYLIIFNLIGTVATIVQKLAVMKLKTNAQVDYMVFITEITTIIVGLLINNMINPPEN